jgi:hypothetical protein
MKNARNPRNQEISATTQQPLDRFKPFKDRSVKVTLVPCPTCKAGVGQQCLSSSGKVVRHDRRRVMALRAGL